MKIAITGACGRIAYALIPRLGEILGDPDSKIDLRLLDIPSMQDKLQGLMMEIDDCAFPFFDKVIATDQLETAFADADIAIFLGAMPRKKGMDRRDLFSANGAIFKEQGRVLNEVASKEVQSLVVGNPCNANAYVLMKNAPSLDPKRFYSMNMLDQNRAVSMAAKKSGSRVLDIDNLIVFGNHSDTMFADYQNARIYGTPMVDVIRDEPWLKETFLHDCAKRGGEIIAKISFSSALSAASATIDTLECLIDRDPEEPCFSLGVCSDGQYGSQEGNIVSLPCYFSSQGDVMIDDSFEHDAFAQAKLAESFADVASEVSMVHQMNLVPEL